MELGAKAGGLLMGGAVRTFDRDHLQEAWDWTKSHPSAGEISQTSSVSIDVAKKGDPVPRETKSAKEKHTPKTNSQHSNKKTHPEMSCKYGIQQH